MYRNGHDAKIFFTFFIKGVELIARAIQKLSRTVVLHGINRDVIELHGIRNGEEAALLYLQRVGLIVVYPIEDILYPFFRQKYPEYRKSRCRPGLIQPRGFCPVFSLMTSMVCRITARSSFSLGRALCKKLCPKSSQRLLRHASMICG